MGSICFGIPPINRGLWIEVMYGCSTIFELVVVDDFDVVHVESLRKISIEVLLYSKVNIVSRLCC